MPDFPFPQQRDDGESKHDRAQHEFLALVDIVLDEDAVPRRLAGNLQRKAGINRDDPGRGRQQRAGRQERDEYPHAARRALEMIEQERQNEQLRRGAQRIEARAPGRVRPQGSQRRQRNERNRKRADRPLQRTQERAQFERRGQSGKPDHHADAHAAGRPRQQHRNQHRDEIDVQHPRERIVPGRGHDRQHRADRVYLPARAIRRHHDDPAGAARALCCLAASVMPPATPTPSTYIHPS